MFIVINDDLTRDIAKKIQLFLDPISQASSLEYFTLLYLKTDDCRQLLIFNSTEQLLRVE